jgi:hypothetical protein
MAKMSRIEQARRAAVAALKKPKPSWIVEIMEGRWDHTPAVKKELAALWSERPL